MRFRPLSCCAAALLLLLGASVRAQVIGDVYASDASVKGSVMLVSGGTRLMSGSSVSAGSATAVVKLARGGMVRVCSRTSISVASSPSGRDLLLGMSTGGIELHYELGTTTDSILTPDFRIQLPGPGTFHLAFGADARGNTCIRSLASNSASVVVTELMGDGTYQVKAGEQVRFAEGRVSAAGKDDGPCGCPAPPPVLRVETPAPQPPKKVEQAVVAQATTPTQANLTAPPPPSPAGEVHMQVDAPFIFSAMDPGPVPPAPTLLRMNFASIPAVPLPEIAPPPPPPPPAPVEQAAQPAKKKKGFFGKLRGFFSSIFGG